MNRKERVNRDSLTFLAIIAIVLFTLMGASALFAQTSEDTKLGFDSGNENIYGTWSSWDGDTIIYMDYFEEGDQFLRVTKLDDGREIAKGTFAIEEKHLYVQKEDNEYRLLFYLKGTQMIVMKPDDAGGAGQAWLLTKVSNYGQTSN